MVALDVNDARRDEIRATLSGCGPLFVRLLDISYKKPDKPKPGAKAFGQPATQWYIGHIRSEMLLDDAMNRATEKFALQFPGGEEPHVFITFLEKNGYIVLQAATHAGPWRVYLK